MNSFVQVVFEYFARFFSYDNDKKTMHLRIVDTVVVKDVLFKDVIMWSRIVKTCLEL